MAGPRRRGFWASLLTLSPVLIGVPCVTIWKHYGVCLLEFSFLVSHRCWFVSLCVSSTGTRTRTVRLLSHKISFLCFFEKKELIVAFLGSMHQQAPCKSLNAPYSQMWSTWRRISVSGRLGRENMRWEIGGCMRRRCTWRRCARRLWRVKLGVS